MRFDQHSYPVVRRDETISDDYHGSKIPDPYRWLEDPDSEETKQFVEKQNAITSQYLQSCDVADKFKTRLRDLWNYPKYRCPFKRGERYFYFYNSGLQNQSVLYVQDSLDSKAEIFLDPNKLSGDGTVALSQFAFSEDGEYFAYALSTSGSDWNVVKFMKVCSKEELTDTLKRVKFSCLSWTHDHKGVFYNTYPKEDGKQDGTETAANLNQKLYYHKLGTPQSSDVLCAEFPDHPKWMCDAEVSDDGRYVILAIRKGCDPVNRLYYCDLEKIDYKINGLLPYVKVVDTFDAAYEYITNEGTVFTFKTNMKAPRYKIININLDTPEMERWQDLITHQEKDVLTWAACVDQNKLVLCYLHDVKNQLYVCSLSNGQKIEELQLDVGTVTGFSGRKKNKEIFYQFASFLTPGRIFHRNFSEVKSVPKLFRETEVRGFDSSQFETSQVFYSSKDGTKIPMFIVHRKGISLDGSHPCYLYGYGGFNVSILPSFSVSRVIFMQNLGGIVAVANIRGGGEYGEEWHKAGTMGRKQNVFDDFQAAAEYLISKKYTSNHKLVINGGSNGGLLVGACINQRPDLYGCAVIQVGVMDMLRFQKFTIGHAWTTDFGSSDNKEDFNWLVKYSPLHNITPPENNIQYPATLLLTADHDDRVVPLHTFKFIAELQNTVGKCEKQKNPLLVRIDTKSGHGAGKPTEKQIEESSDIFGFIAKSLNVSWSE